MTTTTSHTDLHIPPVMERRLPSIADVDITEVYCPARGVPIVADIVFVHGLMGHPRDTWLFGKGPSVQSPDVPGDATHKRSFRAKLFGRNKSRGDSSSAPVEGSKYCFWPYDLLPKDDTVSNARILLYGYDSHPTHFYKTGTNRMTITQHAENLMHNLAGVRAQCRGRPIVFIAHSLGGILVKGALNESRWAPQPQYSDLCSSCRAIVFMGTPHLGADIAAWGTWTSNVVGALPGGFTTYSKVLQGLEPDSEMLYTISRKFNEILNQSIPDAEKIQICSVQEGNGMSSVRGAGSKVVPDFSSKFNRTDIEQSFFNQTANHMTMCKFSSADDQTYKNVLRVLQGYLQTIEQRQADIQRASDTNTQGIVSDFVKKLDFDGRLARERQLNTLVTPEQSFEWVWESSFVDWLKCDAKVFWIAGKPASGKSTLVNHIIKHSRTKTIVEEAFGGSLVVAKFFFDFRAKDGISNNFEGLRRSLMHQLLTQSSALAAEVMQHFGVNRVDDQIMLGDATIFEYALHKNDRPTFIFIDGLDEYQGHTPELLNLIDSITKHKVKVCLSSRYEKPFTTTFKDLVFQFRMESLNESGIYNYAKHTLETVLKPSDDQERRTLDTASRTIADISAGVFLWARFAVSDVVERVCEGHQIKYDWILTIIDAMPAELELVYARIFRSMKDKNKKACGIIFQLIDSASLELELSELFEASLLAGIDFRPLRDAQTIQDLSAFQRNLIAIGGGLVEFVRCWRRQEYLDDQHDPYDGIEVTSVRLIHRSVQTYLSKNGWKELFGGLQAVNSHEIWLNVCNEFLAGKRVIWTTPNTSYRSQDNKPDQWLDRTQQRDYVLNTRSIRDYVYTFLLEHAYEFEQETAKSSWSLIHRVLNAEFVRAHTICVLSRTIQTCDCIDLLWQTNDDVIFRGSVQLAICHRLMLFVKQALSQSPETFRSDSFVSALSPAARTLIPYRAVRLRVAASELEQRCSPLATAVLCYCASPAQDRLELISLCISSSSQLSDVDLLMAIRRLPKQALEALLSQVPARPMQLKSTLLFHDMYKDSYIDENKEFTEHDLGPLWEIGGREVSNETEEVLQLLLARGENINSQCGPIGTVLHSVVLNDINLNRIFAWRPYRVWDMFSLLLRHGADINVRGPSANVLEFTWKRAHLEHNPDREKAYCYAELIESLIDMGATNSIKDPNGLVPSKAHMLTVARREGPSIADRQYYFHGTYPPRRQRQILLEN